MAKCSGMVGKKPCTRDSIGESGFCSKHGGAVAKPTTVTYTMSLACAEGSTTPNGTFSALAEQKIADKPYKLRIEAMRAAGPVTDAGENVHGVMLLHNTQPRNNCTVWYKWVGNSIIIYALGEHAGGTNKKYSMTWYDGSSKSWTRG